jgi:hypothetical protein
MSSPVQSPLPPNQFPPPVPLRRRRSLAGPIVLIILGILFLMVTMHQLSLERLLTLFAHYWPALLILWGVIKLIEHQQAHRDGLPARGIGAGGVFLVIAIVVFGLIATQASRFNWGEVRDNMGIDDNDLNNIFGETYNFDDHLEQPIPTAVTSLRVNNEHGAVRVNTSDDATITVTVRKRVGAENQSDADKFNADTKPTLATTGSVLTLDAKTQAAGNHGVQSDLDISIPRKMALQIFSRRGDISVTGREGEVEVNSQHGDATVEDVTGNVKLNLEKGSATIEQITGDVRINGRLNDVSVSDVKGAAQFEGEFGESVKLARITKSVSFKSSRTDLEFSRIDGDLDLDSDDLHADQITGPVHLTTRDKQIRLEDVSGDVRVQNENGGIEISMRSLGNVQIDSRKGDINLSLPDKAGFHIEARAHDGEIQSDFPELKIDNNDREAKVSGSVGNGSSHIVLNAEHDGIEIRKASSKAAPAMPPAPPTPAKPAKTLPPPKSKVEATDN